MMRARKSSGPCAGGWNGWKGASGTCVVPPASSRVGRLMGRGGRPGNERELLQSDLQQLGDGAVGVFFRGPGKGVIYAAGPPVGERELETEADVERLLAELRERLVRKLGKGVRIPLE